MFLPLLSGVTIFPVVVFPLNSSIKFIGSTERFVFVEISNVSVRLIPGIWS